MLIREFRAKGRFARVRGAVIGDLHVASSTIGTAAPGGDVDHVGIYVVLPTKAFVIPRQARPAEIAEFVTFIASDKAAFATGAEVVAGGGFSLGPVD